MPQLTAEGLRLVTEVATRHGFSADAALGLLDALIQGGGYQAQFNHPEFGGMGQWSQGGLIMIGDMFNNNLKYRVSGLCDELSNLIRNQPSLQAPAPSYQAQSQGAGYSLFLAGGSGSWWPGDLGSPSSSGGQNDMRYAFFPGARRLAIQQGGRTRVYDTQDHQLSGFSQQQGGDQSLTFTSQYGLVRVADLREIGTEIEAPPAAPAYVAPPTPTSEPSPALSPPGAKPPLAVDEILKIIEGLAGLRDKGVLTEAEFAAKKAELLARL